MKIQTKLVFLFIISVLACNVMFSQSSKNFRTVKSVKYKSNVDVPLTVGELNMLKEVYGSKLDKEVLNNPRKVKRIKHLLRNRIEIIEIPNQRDQKPCPKLSEVPLFDVYVNDLKRDLNFNKDTFNPLKYNFDFFSGITHFYRVDNTNYFIKIKSQFQ